MDLTPEERRARRARARRRRVRRRRLAALGAVAALAIGVAAVASGGFDAGPSVPAAAQADGAVAPRPGTPVARPAPATPVARPAGDRARTVRLALVGDIVMGTTEYGLPPDGGRHLFRPVAPLLTGDVVVGNLEGTLTTRGVSKCGAGSPNCFAFRTPPGYAANLRRAGFTVMNLANNHSNDYGPVGLADTVQALGRAGLRETGRPGRYVVVTTRSGVRVAVLGFATYAWANRVDDIPAARALVRRAAAEADVVVVTMHAGAEGSDRQRVRPGVEYYLGENRGDVMAFSRAVVDAGADLVVGHGPHVLRGMEFHRGRLIAYSMGNFTGWKAFSLGGPLGTSGVLQVTLRADGAWVSGRFRPTYMVPPGAPVPGGSGITQVAALSRQDFGARGARIGADGAIRRP